MVGGTESTPVPGMSVPRRTKRRRRLPVRFPLGTLLVTLALNFVWSGAADLLRDDDDGGADGDAAAHVVLTAADLDDGWTEDGKLDSDITIGLTDGEAACLGVDPMWPPVERGSSYFRRGETRVAAQVGVWADDDASWAARDAMAMPDFPSCLAAQLDREQDEGEVSLLGSGPTAADPTVKRFAFLYGRPDGAVQTGEIYQAFKGRTQVVLFTYTPTGVDQVLAVDLLRKMLARVG